MKAIVLAGGYAKRMWPLTKDKPKHLLTVAGRPMLEYVLKELETITHFDKVYIATNEKFADQFREFLDNRENKLEVELVVEPTTKEEDKLGSLGALAKLIRDKGINEETLIIGGDNLFEFKMVDLVRHLEELNENIVVTEDVKDFEKAKLYGIVEVGEGHKIVNFEEKPEQPKSTLAATACYILTAEGVQGLLRYIDEGNDSDDLGHFIEYMVKNHNIYAFRFDGRWFDIGSVDSYHGADEYFHRHRKGFTKLKAIILAAGYATRLYPLTLDRPKPLLPVGEVPIIERIMEKIEPLEEVDEVFVVTNEKFHSHFEEWKNAYQDKTKKKITIINDGTSTNETRLGPIGDAYFVVEKMGLNDDVIVLAGDNLCEIDHACFVDDYLKNRCSVVGLRDLQDPEKVRLKFGVVELDDQRFIKCLEEKPEEPKSTITSTCMYVFKNEDIKLFPKLKEEKGTTEAGEFIDFLISKGKKVYGLVFEDDWYDIGSHEDLAHVNELYKQ
jgi:glucose-1-phosphate thymidylyltransferase